MAEEPTAPETPENPEAAEAASAPEMEAAEAPMPMPVPEEETGADAGNEGGQTVASGKMPTPEGSSEAPAPAAGGEAATGDEGEGAEEAEAPTDKSGLIVAIIAPVVLIPLCYFRSDRQKPQPGLHRFIGADSPDPIARRRHGLQGLRDGQGQFLLSDGSAHFGEADAFARALNKHFHAGVGHGAQPNENLSRPFQ